MSRNKLAATAAAELDGRPRADIALAARLAAEGLRDHAAGPDCFVSDRTAVMASAKGWDLFADALEALD